MSLGTTAKPRRWGRWIIAAAVTAVTGTVVTLAVVWPGVDAQQTPLEDASVWALQTGDGRRYARVNTELSELDTIKNIENPSGIVQGSGRVFVYSEGDTRYADVSLAAPIDLDADAADAFLPTPSGTSTVASAGDALAYLTDTGDVYGARLSTGGSTAAVDPSAGMDLEEDEERPTLDANAVTVTASGTIYAASIANQRITEARADTGEIVNETELTLPETDDLQISATANGWVLLDVSGGQLWLSNREDPIDVDVQAGALLQRATTSTDTAYIADAAGLVAVALDGSGSSRVSDQTGVPAAPTALGDDVYAAWLGTNEGVLWSSADGTRSLDYAAGEVGDDLAPEFSVNGSRGILNETSSGWVWTVPDGELVASSQAWNSEEQTQADQPQELESERVVDPKPPVAVDDAFGVRAGRDIVLPVILNDHDPNLDVLSIAPGTVTGLDPAFGEVRSTNADQQLVVSVSPDATGSATFSYQVTDGTTNDGLLSNTARVTLSVVPSDVNNAPVWCGVDGCLAQWPSPEVVPGGTVTTDVLEAWVDPDGDPVYLAGVTNVTGVGSVTSDPGGKITYQHPDPNSVDAASVQLSVTVSDARGATAEKELGISVTPSPALAADAFAVTGVAGSPLTVDVAEHISGANGATLLASATVIDQASGSVSTNPSARSFTFSSDQPGSYLLQYTVRDSVGEATGTVRITLLAPENAQISTPPLTAFVRPNEDASVEVLTAVSNPAGLVLLVSDLRPEPVANASLSVDSVAQNLIRVSGATDDGEPGTLGTVDYTVSDGSGSPNATTTGELTVILLPSTDATLPIAVDDAVTVRAGAQIDIPVLANDTAPAGALISLDPAGITNESDAGLAFATPRLLRYLAPDEAGTYSLSYKIYRLGFPELTDTARVFITVLPNDTNAAPTPKQLVGRVLSGATVTIPFDSFGVDPDGDAVSLDQIIAQPQFGSAAITSDGSSIIYTSAAGSTGQDSFQYQVRDTQGETGIATVRIGILDQQSDPSPVTYSDYLQAQAGETNQVRVRPADNDVDPAGSALELIDIRPNAIAGSDEFLSLEAMIENIDLDTGEVTLNTGTELGTYAFVYTVRNDTGDTAQGLTVLKVVRNPVLDYPVVTDTTLTAETRERLPDGVDVLDGKVAWTAGDPSGLELSLWDDTQEMRASGSEISGPLPTNRTIVPFQVTGTSFAGAETVSYGFLRVPGENDLTLSLRASMRTADVNEKESVEVDLNAAIAHPTGTSLEFDTAGVTTSGTRTAAQCTVTGSTLTYTAGEGAPWTDLCTFPVKLDTQDEYTYLALRLNVIAEAPQPELRAASFSVSPGSEAVYNLRDMTRWQGENDWNSLVYTANYSGDQFVVTQNGSQLTVRANDASRPGREEPIVVTLSSHPEAVAATLTLTVGPAPSTLPKGGTVTQQCSQAGGNTSCSIQVIGVGGEVNPLPGTALRLVSVSSPANCRGVSFSVASPTTVSATWASDAPGAADCTGSFVVADAQERVSSGDRVGRVVLDLQGLPANPARMTWTGYTGSTVALRVISETSSYPAVTGYRVSGGGQQVTCGADGVCPPITAENGDQISYQAEALNDVGASRTNVAITAWAYERPVAPKSISAEAVPNESDNGKTANVTVSGIDPSTGSIRLRSANGAERTVNVGAGQTSIVFERFDVGANSETNLRATPLTRFEVPPESIVAGGRNEGDAASGTAYGIGRPDMTSWTLTPSNNDSGTATVAATFASNAGGGNLYVGVATAGETCTPASTSLGTSGTYNTSVQGETWEPLTVTICAEYRQGGTRFGQMRTAEKTEVPTAPLFGPGGGTTYAITSSDGASASVRTWSITTPPSPEVRNRWTIFYGIDGPTTTNFSDLFQLGQNPGQIQAFECRTILGYQTCTPGTDITPAVGSPAYPFRISFPTSCDSESVPSGNQINVLANTNDYSTSANFVDQGTYYTTTWTVTFRGALSALSSQPQSYTMDCTPKPIEPEEPEEPEVPDDPDVPVVPEPGTP